MHNQRLSKPFSQRLQSIFTFPHPVNEYAARMVAGMVLALSLAIIIFDIPWLMFILAYGFLSRVLAGPTLSPMGLLATRVLAPILHLNKPVAGPPKRFAQTVGLGFATTAIGLHYGLELTLVAKSVLGILVFFAGLEAFIGFCTGCFVFGYLMHWGLIPQETCDKCSDFSLPPHSANLQE